LSGDGGADWPVLLSCRFLYTIDVIRGLAERIDRLSASLIFTVNMEIHFGRRVLGTATAYPAGAKLRAIQSPVKQIAFRSGWRTRLRAVTLSRRRLSTRRGIRIWPHEI